MNLIHIKFILSLCLALCAVQEGVAFSSTTGHFKIETSIGETTKDARPKLVYFDDSSTLKTELATKHKIPVVFGAVTSKISTLATWRQPNNFSCNILLRDLKQRIKILIFPFHSFW